MLGRPKFVLASGSPRRLGLLNQAGIEPDWVIGTSIGAINASLIAGSPEHARLSRLREFWNRMEQDPLWKLHADFPGIGDRLSYWATLAHGVPGFFRPNVMAHAGDAYPLGERCDFV